MFPFYQQHDAMDCGPTCLQMIAKSYGKFYTLNSLRRLCAIDREGVSLAGIVRAAEKIELRAIPIKTVFKSPHKDSPSLLKAPLPLIVHWNQNHFVVVYKISKKHIWIADPAKGKIKLSHHKFKAAWLSEEELGIALLLETTPAFYTNEEDQKEDSGLAFLFKYIKPHKRLITQLFLGMLLGSAIQLVFPFLTQSVVDIGINNQDIGFIWLILIAQIMLFFGATTVQFIQSWILLHIGTRINVGLISDFLQKMMALPLGFFDSKQIGDLLQRIGDHRRIEMFLTSSGLTILFSLINIIVFSLVLLLYSPTIFTVFLIGTIMYMTWISLFLKRRESVDYERFEELSNNQSALIELIQGLPEIKLQNSEAKHRKAWMNIQAKLYRANMKALSIQQYQDAGAQSITHLKDLIITFIAAKAVIDGNMTLGMLLAVQFIVGQMNHPLQQLMGFIRSAQDAKISLQRLREIHSHEPEPDDMENHPPMNLKDGMIELKEVSFRYNVLSEHVLKKINLKIPIGKTTAIVGGSGSGKTTLIKLLLGFYKPSDGDIYIDGKKLDSIKKKQWRRSCGAVLQDGFLFSKSILENIIESETKDQYDLDKVKAAARTANIHEFIESLPSSYHTKIGAMGNGLSQGQKQRILIARLIYKAPEIIFLDEATNALDAHNEFIIQKNLESFQKEKTVVIAAHRLSTVKRADQIVVLDQGRVAEIGPHKELIQKKGLYFSLVKEQLALDSFA